MNRKNKLSTNYPRYNLKKKIYSKINPEYPDTESLTRDRTHTSFVFMKKVSGVAQKEVKRVNDRL